MAAGNDRLSMVSIAVVTVTGSRMSPSRMIVAREPEIIVAHEVNNSTSRDRIDG